MAAVVLEMQGAKASVAMPFTKVTSPWLFRPQHQKGSTSSCCTLLLSHVIFQKELMIRYYHQHAHPHLCISLCLSQRRLSIYLTIYPSIHPLIHLSIAPSLQLSISIQWYIGVGYQVDYFHSLFPNFFRIIETCITFWRLYWYLTGVVAA